MHNFKVIVESVKTRARFRDRQTALLLEVFINCVPNLF